VAKARHFAVLFGDVRPALVRQANWHAGFGMNDVQQDVDSNVRFAVPLKQNWLENASWPARAHTSRVLRRVRPPGDNHHLDNAYIHPGRGKSNWNSGKWLVASGKREES